MAVTYGFYDSIAGDRLYNTADISSIFDGIINDGVFMSIGTQLRVAPSTGYSIEVGVGRAWFDHTWTYNDSPFQIVLDAPDLVYTRIDAIVLEVNADDAVRANTFKVVKGTPGSVPALPTLTNTSVIHQHLLGHVVSRVGMTSITLSDIVNHVGAWDCPFVTGILSTMSSDDLLVQWEAEFGDWFDEMKAQLSTDAAGNLQLQINELGVISQDLQDQVDNIDSANIVAGAVDNSHLANGASKVIARQGSSGVIWSAPGTTNFASLASAAIQVGQINTGANINGQITVTFPVGFTYAPIVVATPVDGTNPWLTVHLGAVTPTQFTMQVISHSTNSPYHSDSNAFRNINWMAIGPVA